MPKMNPENRLIDKHKIVGKTFSKWTIIEYVGGGRYKAKCECGHEAVKQGAEIMNLRSSQCFHCRKRQLRGITRSEIAARDLVVHNRLDLSDE